VRLRLWPTSPVIFKTDSNLHWLGQTISRAVQTTAPRRWLSSLPTWSDEYVVENGLTNVVISENPVLAELRPGIRAGTSHDRAWLAELRQGKGWPPDLGLRSFSFRHTPEELAGRLSRCLRQDTATAAGFQALEDRPGEAHSKEYKQG